MSDDGNENIVLAKPRVPELPGGADANRFDGDNYGATVSFFLTHTQIDLRRA